MHAVDEALGEQREHDQRTQRDGQRAYTRGCAGAPAQESGRGAYEPHREKGGEQAQDREDRQQPAPEVAALEPHEGEEQKRGRDEHPAERGARAPDRDRAAERSERGHPAETPGERPEVVDEAALARRSELSLPFGGQLRLV